MFQSPPTSYRSNSTTGSCAKSCRHVLRGTAAAQPRKHDRSGKSLTKKNIFWGTGSYQKYNMMVNDG